MTLRKVRRSTQAACKGVPSYGLISGCWYPGEPPLLCTPALLPPSGLSPEAQTVSLVALGLAHCDTAFVCCSMHVSEAKSACTELKYISQGKACQVTDVGCFAPTRMSTDAMTYAFA